MRADRTGYAWGRQKELAAHLGVNVRTLQLKQNELVRAGLIELRSVRRGHALPTGSVSKHQTTLFYPTTPMLQSLKMYDPELHVIRDPSRLIRDPKDLRSSSLTPFCGSDQEVEDAAPETPQPQIDPVQLKLPSIEEIAKQLLRQWQKQLAPHIDLEGPQTKLHRELWVTLIVARLKEGFSFEEMEIAIDYVSMSPHNRSWERRHVLAVFGDAKRLRTLIEYGMSGATFPPPKAKPSEKRLRAKVIEAAPRPQAVEFPNVSTAEEAQAIMDRIEEEERNARRRKADTTGCGTDG